MDSQKSHTAITLLALIFLITATHYVATVFNWYETHKEIDIPLHMLGGAFVALLFIYIFLIRHQPFTHTPTPAILIAGIGFVALVGVGWEFYEFIIDVFVFEKYPLMRSFDHLHFDTLKDLANDLAGGAVVFAVHALRNKKLSIITRRK